MNDKIKTELIVIDSKAYDCLKADLKKETEEAVYNALARVLDERGLESDWISKHEAMKLLGVKSKSKLQDLRDNGDIEFSQRQGERIIIYSKQSILEYLEKNRKRRS